MARCNAGRKPARTPRSTVHLQRTGSGRPHTRTHHTHSLTHTHTHDRTTRVAGCRSPRSQDPKDTSLDLFTLTLNKDTSSMLLPLVGSTICTHVPFPPVAGRRVRSCNAGRKRLAAPVEHTRGDTKAATCTHGTRKRACLGIRLQSSIGARRCLLHACWAVPLSFGD